MTSAKPSTELLRITNPLIADNICKASMYSDSKYHILAIVMSNSDVILWKVTSDNTKHVMKWIPWKNDPDSKIQAVAFQSPTLETVSEHRINLLLITHDATIHLVSVDEVISGENSTQKSVKYSLFANSWISPFLPTALVWWNSSHRVHKNIAIIGGNSGQLIFYSITQACYLASLNTGIKTPIFSLSICSDFFRDFSYLIITNDLRQQWKLLLEKEVNGEHFILVSFEQREIKSEKSGENVKSQKSRLQEFKQISVETFTMLKQKLQDAKKTNVERPKPGNNSSEFSELEACDCYGDAFLSVQVYKNRRVLSGMFIPESVLMLFLQNKESNVLLNYKFQVSPLVTTLLLTNSFVYVADIMETKHRVLVFSSRISESKKSETMEYNPASFIQCFFFPENEQILFLFLTNVKLPINEKAVEAALPINQENSSSSQSRSKIKQMQVEEDWSEACLVVTNKGVYVISLRNNPLNIALESFKTDISLIKKLPFIFNVPLMKIIEYVSDELVEKRNVRDAVDLCNDFKCYSGRMTLKLASYGFIDEMLEYTDHLLNQNDLDLPHVEKIHLSNTIISCHVEKYLRNPSDTVLEQKFRKILKENRFFDEEVNIYMLGNYRLCSFLHFLCVWRGLYVDATVALTNMIAQNQFDKYNILHKFDGFWELFSEISLVDAFVLSPRTVHLHIDYLREYLVELPPNILKRLYNFYNPTQSVLKPAMNRMLHVSKEEYFDAYDLENDKWGCDANMFDWITNFLFLHLRLFNDHGYDKSLSRYVVQSLNSSIVRFPELPTITSESPKSMSSPVLSAGMAHAALVRDGSLVTWGYSYQGCLGTGPSLSTNSSPTLNAWFDDHRIRVKSVSCGRYHTLALTENGVYAWGSSKFGQLGVGHLGQSVYPRLVETLSTTVIVSVSAGQYHSLAVDVDGKLWTWGWGVYGQLGHGDTEDQYYPKCVEKLKKKTVTSACGGQAHSVVLTIKGKVFTFGCNAYGQLGTATNIKSSTPVKVFGLQENVVMIATNYFHNLALSYSNRLYTWGCSPQILKMQAHSLKRSKSLMNAEKNPSEVIVNLDRFNMDLISTSAGHSADSATAVAEPDPEVIEYGKHLTPTLVDTSHVEGNIMQVSCGLFHSALLTTEGQTYTWGRNTDGQLGNCKRQTLEVPVPTWVHIVPSKYMPSSRDNVVVLNQPLWRVSCGKDFTLVAELEGRIFGWGNNLFGQLGSPPQEDLSLKKFLNGKFIMNKYAKRLIKFPNSGVNIVEIPTEITSIPKLQYLFAHNGNCPDRYLRMERNVDLPGLSYSQYSIESIDRLRSLNVSQEQLLHYYLECFHEYYNADFILRMAAKIGNFQAVAKICCLNYRFYEAFFYELKSLLSYVREKYFISSFKDGYGASKNSVVTQKVEDRNDDQPEKSANFGIVEDTIAEAVSILKYYCEMTLKFTSRKIESFLKKSISTWIVWELPMKPLEEFFSLHLDTVAYHLAVFLFCNGHKAPNPSNQPEVSNSSHISSSRVKENKLCSSSSSSSSSQKSMSQTVKTTKYPFYPFTNSDETKASYRNLYQRESAVHLESTDAKYRLKPEQILGNLSVQFLLELCAVVVDSVSTKSPSEYEEFIRLMHEIIFAPSVLKSDDRSADEILSSVLNTLQRSQSSPKKFIQISYQELQNRTIEDKFIAFSCRHFFTSQKDFERDVRTVTRELDGLRLLNTSELVNRLYSNSTFNTCCPNCLFRCIQGEINASNSTKI